MNANTYRNRHGTLGVGLRLTPSEAVAIIDGEDSAVFALMEALAEIASEVRAADLAERQLRAASWSEIADECPHSFGETGRGQCRRCGEDMVKVGAAQAGGDAA